MNVRVKATIKAYRGDMLFRARVMLYINLAINCVYAVFEAVCGYLFSSAWMGTLAFYYIVLAFIRYYIFRKRKFESITHKWKAYRICGVVMLTLTIAVVGIHILTMNGYHSIEYPGYMIYAVAAYSFYATANAIRNVIIYRKANDPIISASKAINLAVAAVSMYNLQSAVITAFGDDDEAFRITMGNCVGAGVLVVIVCISAVMIMRANKAVRKSDV